MRMKRKLGKALMIVGALLVLAAAGLVGYNTLADRRAGESAAALTAQLTAQLPAATSQAPRAATPATPESGQAAQAPDPGDRTETDAMPGVRVDGRECIGVLDMPSLGLSLPLLRDYSEEALTTAPCCYTGSLETGDLVVAGHNYRSQFGKLPNLSVGSELSVTDVGGGVYSYVVSSIETLNGDDVEGMLAGDWDLTLFTCTMDGTQRVTVRCVRA